jgi:hypothetical protein
VPACRSRAQPRQDSTLDLLRSSRLHVLQFGFKAAQFTDTDTAHKQKTTVSQPGSSRPVVGFTIKARHWQDIPIYRKQALCCPCVGALFAPKETTLLMLNGLLLMLSTPPQASRRPTAQVAECCLICAGCCCVAAGCCVTIQHICDQSAHAGFCHPNVRADCGMRL